MMNSIKLLLLSFIVISLNACVSIRGGGDIQDSGPTRAVDLSHVEEPVPRYERRTIAGNKTPYTVLGKTYFVDMDVQSYKKQGIASWYGRKFHGRNTSNGEVYDMYAMTAAHKTLPIPSYVKVTNLENGKQITVRVNDRGPFHQGRIIDLSYAGASRLGFSGKGTAQVEVELIDTSPAGESTPNQNTNVLPIIQAQVQAPPVQIGAVTQSGNDGESNTTFVQAGAFSSQESAISMQEKLSALMNYPVFVESIDAVSRLFKVRIGPIINDLEFSKIKEIMSDNNLGVPYLVQQ